MNTPNAYAFFGAGLMMELLHFMPGVTGVRELWLIVMGAVLMLTGGVYLANEAWVWVKPRMVTPMLAWVARPAEADARGVPEGRRASV